LSKKEFSRRGRRVSRDRKGKCIIDYNSLRAPRDETSLIALGLGSNLGDSRVIILEAIKALEEILSELRCASFYETAPLYVMDQGFFINTVVTGLYGGDQKSLDAARELLSQLHKIEESFGRDRAGERRWGERLLDIDILLFGDLTVNEADIIIPHPRLKERRFVLEPLLEILPDAKEPGTGLSYRSICQALPDQGVKRL
jgi:2-amino-4-hydroxy-6-hydroxymethyldihydropteridine diphosphokinase